MTNRLNEDYEFHRNTLIAYEGCNCKWCLKAIRASKKTMNILDNLLKGNLE